VYRLGNPSYINRLDGEGAAKVGGRWNSVGQAVVYTAQTSSLAILEVLGHISNPAFYLPYQLVHIEIDSALCMDYTTFSPALPEGWATKAGGEKITKNIGTEWLSEAKAPYLKVPSVHNPLEHNYLLNPQHAKFESKIVHKHWYLYHDRLVKKSWPR
jgi:RES domain-containing protein